MSFSYQFVGVARTSEGFECAVFFNDKKASSPQQAMENFNAIYEDEKIISCSYRHGGSRVGSGRRKKWAEDTKMDRVPVTFAENSDEFLNATADILDLLNLYREFASHSPTSPRYDKIRKLLEEAKESMEIISKVVNAFRGDI